MVKVIEITGNKYYEVRKLQDAGFAEWQAVAKVLDIPENTNFVVNALGTSSNPKDGLRVTLL